MLWFLVAGVRDACVEARRSGVVEGWRVFAWAMHANVQMDRNSWRLPPDETLQVGDPKSKKGEVGSEEVSITSAVRINKFLLFILLPTRMPHFCNFTLATGSLLGPVSLQFIVTYLTLLFSKLLTVLFTNSSFFVTQQVLKWSNALLYLQRAEKKYFIIKKSIYTTLILKIVLFSHNLNINLYFLSVNSYKLVSAVFINKNIKILLQKKIINWDKSQYINILPCFVFQTKIIIDF